MWIKDNQSPVDRAVADFTVLVEFLSHMPNTERTPGWWALLNRKVCAKYGIPNMNARQPKNKGVTRAVVHSRMALALEMAAAGHTVPSAAKELNVSQNTVKTHRKRAMRALGAHTMVQAVAIAIREGLIRGGHDGQAGDVGGTDSGVRGDADRGSDGAVHLRAVE